MSQPLYGSTHGGRREAPNPPARGDARRAAALTARRYLASSKGINSPRKLPHGEPDGEPDSPSRPAMPPDNPIAWRQLEDAAFTRAMTALRSSTPRPRFMLRQQQHQGLPLTWWRGTPRLPLVQEVCRQMEHSENVPERGTFRESGSGEFVQG